MSYLWHAHIETHSTDEDGPHSYWYDILPDTPANDLDTINDCLSLLHSLPDEESGPCEMRVTQEDWADESGDGPGRYVVEATQRHLMGSVFSRAVVCDRDDYDPEPTQRDVYAERMGY